MSISRIPVCVSLLAAATFAISQTPPTFYTIAQNTGTPGGTSLIDRSGSKALVIYNLPAQGSTPASRTYSLYDLGSGTSFAWNPDDKNVPCSVNTFSGDWGDPFAATSDVTASIKKGELKPAGTETIDGIATQIYAGSTSDASEKVWFDVKDGLVLRLEAAAPGAAMMRWVDITKVSFAAPDPNLFILPAACASQKPPPTAKQVIADETGDSADNYVSAFYGPGSKDSCNVMLRVVKAKTMTPLMPLQVAIDTQYDQNDPNPPHYNFGVADSGRETFSGGHLHEITTGIHDGMVDLGTLPPYFNMVVNAVHPGHSGGPGLIYRQCFAPTTVLLFIYKNFGQADESVDALWVKSGKYVTPPVQ